MSPSPAGRTNAGTSVITNVLRRQRRALGGNWNVIVDPYEMGYWTILGEKNPHGFFRDFTPRHRGDRVEYDFDASPTLTVPGDWNTQDERLFYYEGTVWYRRRLEVAPGEFDGRRVFLHCGAVNHTTRVFLDGEELATHVGGFSPFAVELTGRLDAGTHSLVLQADNRREPDRVPALQSDWWNFGGPTRDVSLVVTPETFLRDAWLTMAPDGSVVGGVSVDGPDDAGVLIRLPGVGVETALAAGETALVLDVDPARWHPGRPLLHTVEWRCGDDLIRDEVGFRTVVTDGADIVVNGARTWLRGISIHSEGPSGGRRANGPDDARTLLGWAEELGANFVRLAHYQHDEWMLHEADRRGLLAWCELPVYWGIAFDRPHVLENACDQVDELVTRDRSRASVVLWSMANETLPTEARTDFLTQLVQRTRELDPTRLVSAALLTMPTEAGSHDIDDPLGEVVDVLAVNQYLGWYYGKRETIPDATWSNRWGKPVVFTELGAGAKAGRHGEPDEIWTEEFQDAVYAAQIEMVRRQRTPAGGCVAGMSPWILKDFRAPVRVLPGVQDGYNRKGLVSEEGERKLAFGTLREFYGALAADGSERTTQ